MPHLMISDFPQDQGLGLHELTVLAATLEHLIHDEVSGRVRVPYGERAVMAYMVHVVPPPKNMWGFPKMVGFPPKSSILMGFSIINHPFWGTPIFGNTHVQENVARFPQVHGSKRHSKKK